MAAHVDALSVVTENPRRVVCQVCRKRPIDKTTMNQATTRGRGGWEGAMSSLVMEKYVDQIAVWPVSGKHVLAQFDDASVVVYQAYKPSMGEPAGKSGRFGECFAMSRMTWIKPNFLWMMYRSGWGTKPDQETTLAIRLKRTAFDALFAEGVLSAF